MAKKLPLPHTSRHVLIFDEDWELLDKLFGKNSKARTGVAEAIRTIVHQKARALRARFDGKLDELADEAKAQREAELDG